MTARFEVGKEYMAKDVFGNTHSIVVKKRTAKFIDVVGSVNMRLKIRGLNSESEMVQIATKGLPVFINANGFEAYEGLENLAREVA